MRPVLRRNCLRVLIFIQVIILLIAGSPGAGRAQCLAGSNTANLNWDNLDYLIITGSYSGYVTAAMSQTQAFMLGVNRVVIVYPASITTSGENTTHTGEAGSFGTGADVQYNGNGTITLTFDSEVNNLRFSIYDLDVSQRLNVTATNASAIPLLITMTQPGTTLTITGSGTTNAQAQAPAGAQANNSSNGTANISITGPVASVNLALSGTAGDFWLSDFTACVVGTFPIDYFVGSRPFTGQPTYVIGTSDINTVSLINVTTGQAKMIFEDPTSPMYINGLGYDHLEHNLYYVIDFTSTPATNKTIKKFNFDTETMSVLVPNVNTLGIPTFTRGVESAGCAFYDYDLYFGVEGNIGGNNGNRETIIWRIEFDVPGGNAIKAAQVYATPSDNGAGTVLHDWNDFTVADGLLVDFAGSPTASARRFTHYDLQTQTIVNNYYTGGLTPRQAGITWDDTRYWVYDSIAVYNMNGTIGPRTRIFGATAQDWTGFCGDATGFRPKSDFGDAPATYDPMALSPALHEKDTALRLGPTWDQEFDKISSVNADADGTDEDCLATVNVLDTALTNYLADITVYNNTGSNVTVIGWLDINGNGTFEPGEGRSVTVPHGGPVLQPVTIAWNNINTPLNNGQTTYLRFRVARSASGMTINNATGYYNNGEVEDYRVYINSILPVTLVSFDAQVIDNKKVKLDWTVENEVDIISYAVERSFDGIDWMELGSVAANNLPGLQAYNYIDISPYYGKSYYRIRINEAGQSVKYSGIRSVNIAFDKNKALHVVQATMLGQLQFILDIGESTKAMISILDASGRRVHKQSTDLVAGSNYIQVNSSSAWAAGGYVLIVDAGLQRFTAKFLIGGH